MQNTNSYLMQSNPCIAEIHSLHTTYIHITCDIFLYKYSAVEQFIRRFPNSMNIKKDDGYTPLHLASLNDHLDVITALAELVSTILV